MLLDPKYPRSLAGKCLSRPSLFVTTSRPFKNVADIHARAGWRCSSPVSIPYKLTEPVYPNDHHVQWIRRAKPDSFHTAAQSERGRSLGPVDRSSLDSKYYYHLPTDASAIELADPTATAILQPFSDRTAAADGGEERIVVVPERLLWVLHPDNYILC